MRVVVVGPCGSGKTVLVASLSDLGYDARECVQEHSHLPDMWQRISKPDVLIYLEVALESLCKRKPGHAWTQAILDEQLRRLTHARSGSDLTVETDDLTEGQVLQQVLGFLSRLE